MLITLAFAIKGGLPFVDFAGCSVTISYTSVQKGAGCYTSPSIQDIQLVKCVRLSPKALISQGFAGVSL